MTTATQLWLFPEVWTCEMRGPKRPLSSRLCSTRLLRTRMKCARSVYRGTNGKAVDRFEAEYNEALHLALWLDLPAYKERYTAGRWKLERYIQRSYYNVPSERLDLPNPNLAKWEVVSPDTEKIDPEWLSEALSYLPELHRRAERVIAECEWIGPQLNASLLVLDAYNWLFEPLRNGTPRMARYAGIHRIRPELNRAFRRSVRYWVRPEFVRLNEATVTEFGNVSGNRRYTKRESNTDNGSTENQSSKTPYVAMGRYWSRPVENSLLAKERLADLFALLETQLEPEERAALMTYAEVNPGKYAESSYSWAARELGISRRWLIELVQRARRKLDDLRGSVHVVREAE